MMKTTFEETLKRELPPETISEILETDNTDKLEVETESQPKPILKKNSKNEKEKKKITFSPNTIKSEIMKNNRSSIISLCCCNRNRNGSEDTPTPVRNSNQDEGVNGTQVIEVKQTVLQANHTEIHSNKDRIDTIQKSPLLLTTKMIDTSKRDSHDSAIWNDEWGMIYSPEHETAL